MDVFDRKIDITLCAENFKKEIDLLTNESFSFDDFKDTIKRNSSIGKIELEHIRPFIWKIMLNEQKWKSKRTLNDIVSEHILNTKTYITKLKSISQKKKFKSDPLAHGSEGDWKQFYQTQEVKKILDVDLIRTYPDKPLFQRDYIKQIIINTLLIWSQENSDVSYKQGMNEITAIIIYSIYPYYFIDNDMKSDNEKIKEYIGNSEKYKKEIYQYFFNKNTLAGDVYLIFDMIMKNGMKDLYESKEGNSSTNNKNYKYYDLFAFKCENEELDDHSKLKNRCDVIIKEKLNKIDGDLMNHFKKIDINCMVFLQKWIKCIFNREFTPSNVIIIWDNIIAEGKKNFEYIDFICIAILEQMKKDLINNDQDESFQIIFNFKNNDVNALNIVSEAFDFENLFYNKNKPKNESHISNSSITSSVNNKVYSSNPTSFMTPYQILDADKREKIVKPQTAKPTNPIEEKLVASAHSTSSSNFPVPNFGSYFSKIGSYIKEVVSVEPGILNNPTTNTNINQNEMISYYPRDIADNVAHLEYFLQKTRQYLSPDEIKQYEATIRFFKLGGMCGK